MTNGYLITEPHPTVPSTRYLSSGRGGAGNAIYADPSHLTRGPTASGPASRLPLPPTTTPTTPYSTGRGGAGNMRPPTPRGAAGERAIFAFDEELAAQARLMDHAAPVYHVGRGGAGNAVDEFRRAASSKKAGSEGGSSAGESGGEGHGRKRSVEEAWAKVARTFSRRAS